MIETRATNVSNVFHVKALTWALKSFVAWARSLVWENENFKNVSLLHIPWAAKQADDERRDETLWLYRVNFIVHKYSSLTWVINRISILCDWKRKAGEKSMNWYNRAQARVAQRLASRVIFISNSAALMTNELSKQSRACDVTIASRAILFVSLVVYRVKKKKNSPDKTIVMSSTRAPQFNNLR
jgi:hypothetical protein